MRAEHRARVQWSPRRVRQGLFDRKEVIAPAWLSDAIPQQEEGWSLVLRFDRTPLEQGNPTMAFVHFFVENAPHDRLRTGAVLRLFEELPGSLATVEILGRDWRAEHEHRVAAFPPEIREAHPHSIGHRREIFDSTLCGCFYCCAIFSPEEIDSWVDEVDDVGQTALCPSCGIDAVIGDRSGFAITPEFLATMHSHWFE